jgi:hypothetical protein
MNTREEKWPSLYSLAEDEKRGLPSAYQIYMNSIDEHDAALKLVGSHRHWRKLCSLKWFMEGAPDWGYDGLVRWRIDMVNRDRSLAKGILLANTKKGDTPSAKRLLDESKIIKEPVSKKDKQSTDNQSIFNANKIAELHQKRFGDSKD